MEIVLVAVIGALNILCFLIGVKTAQKVSNNERVEMPSFNPLKAIREHEAKKQAEMEQNKLETIMRNIERYDGTGRNQEDVGR